MPKCPYCKNEIKIEDFFWEFKDKKRHIKVKQSDFKGLIVSDGAWNARIWVCPSCDTILSISESKFAYG